MKTNSSPVLRKNRSTPRSPHASEAKIRLAIASAEDREKIYRIRHEIYAQELGQHGENGTGQLRDGLDTFNSYIVAFVGEEIGGFISITPPGGENFSIDKYVRRDQLPFAFDHGVYEVRLLTVTSAHRGRALAALLMYAAFRWVEARGGTRIVGIGRREIIDLYKKAGLQTLGLMVHSGKVHYEVMHASVDDLRQRVSHFEDLFGRQEPQILWQLPFAFRKPASCFHGGAFFKAIGEQFNSLEKSRVIINADVLDAWFPPSPKVTTALQEHLPWLLRTSPPTGCEGLIQSIAKARSVPPECILPGAGSSDLIFLALRQWLSRASRALILDPTYGEYAHVLEKVIGCQVDRLRLARENNYDVNLAELEVKLSEGYDLVVLVNPNSPTGRHISREALEKILRAAPPKTRIWIDETYIEYAGTGESLETFASRSENVVICKSMSKVYALSGARCAYLCAAPHLLEDLRAITPPWAVSLLGQVAAVRALEDLDYYAIRYWETHLARKQLAKQLDELGLDVVPGVANFLLCHLPGDGLNAATVVQRCREQNVFLRDASVMGTQLGDRTLRIAVKDTETNQQIVDALQKVLVESVPNEHSSS